MKLLNLALCAVIAAGSLYAQTATATITGTITDPSGAVIANAPVTVNNLENGQVFTAASSTTGNFTVSQLPIGDYDLTVAVPGFKTYTHTGFHLAAGQTMREDVPLEVGQSHRIGHGHAEARCSRPRSSEVSQNVTLAQLNNLPILSVGATNSGFRDPCRRCVWSPASATPAVPISPPALRPAAPRWWSTERRPTPIRPVWTA